MPAILFSVQRLFMSLFSKKSFDSVREASSKSALVKNLTALDLIFIGLGGIIGTGVFVLIGLVAAQYSGPAIMLSYATAGLCCVFVSLAYSELATMLPTSGSVYSYSYVAFGRIFAWILSGMLALELVVGSATVAAGWSGYVVGVLNAAGFHLPTELTTIYTKGGFVNLPALVIVTFVGAVLYLGTKDSKRLNAFLVITKVLAVGGFIIAATPHFDISNWDNFMPYGFEGVASGASILFFAYTGFGTIAAAAEECKNPKRDLTIGLVGSLVISAAIYILVGGLATGIVSYQELNNAEPLARALTKNGSNVGSAIVAFGAIAGMTTVIMMNIYGISRILYVMSRDGMMPNMFEKLHPKYKSPSRAIVFLCIVIGTLAATCPLQLLGQISSMGSLVNYSTVLVIVMLFRITMPNANRPFKCPAIFIIAPVALIMSLYLLSTQIINKNFVLLLEGKVLIGIMVGYTLLYFVIQSFVKRQNK